MADKKTIVLSLQTTADQAKAEIQRLTHSLREAKFAEQEAKAAGDEHKLALIAQKRALASAKDAQKQATESLKRHNAVQEKAKQQSAGLKDSLIQMKAGWIATAAAIAGAVKAISSFVKAGVEWSGTIQGVERDVSSLRVATDGIIGDVALSRLAEFKRELGLTDKQAQAVAKAAVQYGRINKTDFDSSIKVVTDSVVTLRKSGLEKLGLQLDLTGKKAEQQAQVIAALEGKYGDLKVSASNASEAQDKLGNAWDRMKASIGSVLVDALKLDKAFVAIANGLDRMSAKARVARAQTVGAEIGALTAYVAEQKKLVDLKRKEAEWHNKYVKGTGLEIRVQETKAYKELIQAQKRLNYLRKIADSGEKPIAQISKQKVVEREVKLAEESVKKSNTKINKFQQDSYDSQVVAYREFLEKMRELREQSEKRRVAEEIKNAKIIAANEKNDAAIRWKAFKEEQKRKDKAAKEQKKHHDELVEKTTAVSSAIVNSAMAAAAGEQSFLGALSGIVSGYLKQKAIVWGAEALANYAAYAASWFMDGSKLTAALGYTAAATAAGAGSVLLGSMSGGGGGGGASSGSSTGPASSSPINLDSSINSSGGGGGSGDIKNVTNIYMNGRSTLISRKEVKGMVKRMNQGRL